MQSSKTTIGRNVYVEIVGHAKQVPAKIDTGADSSSIWASGVCVLPNGKLHFTLFDESSSFYSAKPIETSKYSVATVRSSSGHEEIRYRTALSIRIKGKRIKATFNLSDRSSNHFPILIGRKLLNNKFLVDVTLADDTSKREPRHQRGLNKQLASDPYAFYKKYHGRDL